MALIIVFLNDEANVVIIMGILALVVVQVFLLQLVLFFSCGCFSELVLLCSKMIQSLKVNKNHDHLL